MLQVTGVLSCGTLLLMFFVFDWMGKVASNVFQDGEKNGMDEQPSTTREASSADKEEDIVESDIGGFPV